VEMAGSFPQIAHFNLTCSVHVANGLGESSHPGGA
jgi:hypothetical protein